MEYETADIAELYSSGRCWFYGRRVARVYGQETAMRYGRRSVAALRPRYEEAWAWVGNPHSLATLIRFPVRAVLQHHYPDVPCHGDFTTTKDDEYGAIDLLVGGTPCQSFSVAGREAAWMTTVATWHSNFGACSTKGSRWAGMGKAMSGVLSSTQADFGASSGRWLKSGMGSPTEFLTLNTSDWAKDAGTVFVVGYLGDCRQPRMVLSSAKAVRELPPQHLEGEKLPPLLATGHRVVRRMEETSE